MRFRYRLHHEIPTDVQEEMRFYLQDSRGWSALGYELVEVTNRTRKTDVVIYLLPKEEMDRKYGNMPHLRGMSITDTGSRPYRIDLHQTNWFVPPAAFQANAELLPTMSREEQYRCYVTNHEMGHALGYDHVPARQGMCAVMYQQTRGTGPSLCVANPFPSVNADNS
jgi:hypothetical protein